MSATVGYTDAPRSEDEIMPGTRSAGRVVEYGAGTHRRWSPGSLVVAMPMIATGGRRTSSAPQARDRGVHEQIVMQSRSRSTCRTACLRSTPSSPSHYWWGGTPSAEPDHQEQTAYVIGAAQSASRSSGCSRPPASARSSPPDLPRPAGSPAGWVPTSSSTRTADLQSSPHPPAQHDPRFLSLGFDAMEKAPRITRTPWWPSAPCTASRLGDSRPVVFECVRVPGMIDSILGSAPDEHIGRGRCVSRTGHLPPEPGDRQGDRRPVLGRLRPGEFATRCMLADGTVGPEPARHRHRRAARRAAFSALGDPDATPRS
ncbi:hypothetical protein HBB16_01950 [Pseudonocardia sp. MCCB 268]|nr:hypothetical protein [Pseudonocardia cytotoxica]